MADDPQDPNDRELVWDYLRWTYPELMPSPKCEGYNAWREQAIDAEIERRRIAAVHRANIRRALRGEPMVEP